MARCRTIIWSLTAGVVASVAVAWGCALWVEALPSRFPAKPTERLVSRVPREWTQQESILDGARTAVCFGEADGRGIGTAIESCSVELTQSPGADAHDVVWATGMVTARRSGWPLYCLECERVWNQTSMDRVVGGVEPPSWLQRSPRAGAATAWAETARPGLPLRPLAWGFAVDTLLYATVVAVFVKAARSGEAVVEATRWVLRLLRL